MVSSKPSVKQLRLGMIPFWNLLPLRVELSRQQYGDIIVRTGLPSSVNQWLQEGSIDLAPCSSVCLVSKSDFEMALPLGVTSNGPVKSVYLGLYHEHEPILERITALKRSLQEIFLHGQTLHGFDCRNIAKYVWANINELPPIASQLAPPLKLTSASASGAALTKILYYIWFGKEAYDNLVSRNFSTTASGRRPIELLIGDEALIQKRNFYKTLDLGAIWKDLTGLPFVYAVWQSRGACLNGWRRKILAAGELAESRMKVSPSSYLPDHPALDCQGKPISLSDYWKVINYKLGPQDFKGLLIFLCLTRHLQAIPLGEAFAVKLMRWQEISQSGTIPQL